MVFGTIGRLFTVKMLVRVALMVFSLTHIGIAHSQPSSWLHHAGAYDLEWSSSLAEGGNADPVVRR
jgi:hypothetical protein